MATRNRPLALCDGEDEQIQWVTDALNRGRIVCDTDMFLSGVDEPQKLIRKLRKRGTISIVTTKKWITDLDNVWHHDLAWRLESTPEQEDPRA